MFNRLLKMASFRDEEAGYRGVVFDDERTENLVSTNKDNTNTVDAQILMHPTPTEVGIEAFAMWPSDVEVAVPQEWKAGDKVPAAGPHGRIHFELPEQCVPGTTVRFRLKPAPDLRIQVPSGLSAGSSMTFERGDGSRISITVPPGKKPGDFFEVTPPALMVLVPEEVKAGETVVFYMPAQAPSLGQWFKAQVPESLQLGKYFAARLPAPDAAQIKGGSLKASAVAGPESAPLMTEQLGPENADEQDHEAPLE